MKTNITSFYLLMFLFLIYSCWKVAKFAFIFLFYKWENLNREIKTIEILEVGQK